MARRRMIDPNIWQSEDFSKLSVLARLLFIGMFSLADDYGKGRGKPVYLKSIIFPYDDGMRIIDIEKALSEIGSNMSVTFYASNGNDYYRLDNWDTWQRVDKPQPSKIPDFDTFQNHSRIIPESVENGSSLKEKKLKEVNIREEKIKERGASAPAPLKPTAKFIPPTPEDVSAYCQERSNGIDGQAFCDFYQSKGWKIGDNSMKDWKAAVRTWEQRSKNSNQNVAPYHKETRNERNNRLIAEQLAKEAAMHDKRGIDAIVEHDSNEL